MVRKSYLMIGESRFNDYAGSIGGCLAPTAHGKTTVGM
jgi:hypothetical protein